MKCERVIYETKIMYAARIKQKVRFNITQKYAMWHSCFPTPICLLSHRARTSPVTKRLRNFVECRALLRVSEPSVSAGCAEQGWLRGAAGWKGWIWTRWSPRRPRKSKSLYSSDVTPIQSVCLVRTRCPRPHTQPCTDSCLEIPPSWWAALSGDW